MEGVRIIKKPRLKNPYLIVAWPGMGEVAFKAATYLVEKLSAEVFAEINPKEFFYFSGSSIREGLLDLPQLPYNKFYYWKSKSGKNDLVIFISSAQPDLSIAESYYKRIIEAVKGFGIKTVIGFAAMPQPIDHTEQPKVWFAATSGQINDRLKGYDFSLLTSGQISGMNGLFLGLAKREKLDGFCLLGEIPLYAIQIENPRATHAVLEALCKILHIEIDFADLIEQTHLIENEINKLLDYLKGTSSSTAPIGEEEIERIKRALSQLTKLPVSVKEKIEKLFAQAKDDVKKANELKMELDTWNVYKEYEDRFLDLFKKQPEKGN